ncbi:MAG: hypothetical protein GYA56_05565 [Geobacteraceae bacterium]|nr:hypothetical protein [Geobacteraceae bacterium]
MRKAVFVSLAAGLLLAAPVLAADAPQASTPYNCDFQPSCEVAPGFYGKMEQPVTSKFKVSIGGFVKLDYVYNSVNLGPSGALTPGSGKIPKTTSKEGEADQSIFTARQSRVWLKVAGPGFLGAKTNALIEADFYGDPSAAAESPQVRMRQAWGSIDWAKTQLLFGQTFEIFGPMVSSTIDFRHGAAYGTPNNPRVPQLRLTQRIDLSQDNALKLVVGLQDPNQNGNNNAGGTLSTGTFGSAVNVAGQAMFVSKALGVAPGLWGLSMNSLTAGFFGLFGSEKVMLAPGNKAVDSWGYGFYSFVPVLKSSDGKSRAMTMSFEGQAYMAANMAFNSATADTMVGTTEDPKAAKGYGFAGQLIFYPIQDLGITAGYQRRNAYNYSDYTNRNITISSQPTSTTLTGANFVKSSTNIYVNVSYDLNAAVRVAAEYQNVNTQYGNNTPGTSGTGTANIGRLAFLYFF